MSGASTGTGGGTGARIVAAAADLLDETGDQSAVTLRAVARRAGLSAPGIYGHFPDVTSILLVVVQEAFAELTDALRTAAGARAPQQGTAGAQGPEGAAARLHAVSAAYLDFAARRPQRYRAMFGGLFSATRALDSPAVDRAAVQALGRDALAVFVTAVRDCVDAGASASTDVVADAVALWLGLHGLADQRSAAPAFPWPPDIAPRLVTAQARLVTTEEAR